MDQLLYLFPIVVLLISEFYKICGDQLAAADNVVFPCGYPDAIEQTQGLVLQFHLYLRLAEIHRRQSALSGLPGRCNDQILPEYFLAFILMQIHEFTKRFADDVHESNGLRGP